jgi:hypothetical protein
VIVFSDDFAVATGSPEGARPEGGIQDRAEVQAVMEVIQLIGAGVGIVMVQRELCYQDASAFLRQLARQYGRPVDNVARDITAAGWTRPLRFGSEPARGRSRTELDDPGQRLEESMAGRLLDLLIETTDLPDLLRVVAEMAVETVPGCESASITVIHDGASATVATSPVRLGCAVQKSACVECVCAATVLRQTQSAAVVVGPSAVAGCAGVRQCHLVLERVRHDSPT